MFTSLNINIDLAVVIFILMSLLFHKPIKNLANEISKTNIFSNGDSSCN